MKPSEFVQAAMAAVNVTFTIHTVNVWCDQIWQD